MAVSRADRRRGRAARVAAVFGPERVDAALDLLELVEFAWHDCYGESSPSEAIIDEILEVSEGRLDGLIAAGRLAVIDRRDLHLSAMERRGTTDA